jgi:MFS family permease
MALSPKWYQFMVSLFASLGSYLFGYDLGVIAEVIASGNFMHKFNASLTQQGVVVSLFTGGAFCGAFFGGPSGDYLGRRWTIIICSVVFLLGGALQTGASSLEFLSCSDIRPVRPNLLTLPSVAVSLHSSNSCWVSVLWWPRGFPTPRIPISRITTVHNGDFLWVFNWCPLSSLVH